MTEQLILDNSFVCFKQTDKRFMQMSLVGFRTIQWIARGYDQSASQNVPQAGFAKTGRRARFYGVRQKLARSSRPTVGLTIKVDIYFFPFAFSILVLIDFSNTGRTAFIIHEIVIFFNFGTSSQGQTNQ